MIIFKIQFIIKTLISRLKRMSSVLLRNCHKLYNAKRGGRGFTVYQTLYSYTWVSGESGGPLWWTCVIFTVYAKGIRTYINLENTTIVWNNVQQFILLRTKPNYNPMLRTKPAQTQMFLSKPNPKQTNKYCTTNMYNPFLQRLRLN